MPEKDIREWQFVTKEAVAPGRPRLWSPGGVEALHDQTWYNLGNLRRPYLRIKNSEWKEGWRIVEASCLAHTRPCVQSPGPQGPKKIVATFIFAKGKKKYKFPDTYNCFQQTLPSSHPLPPKSWVLEYELTFNQLPTIGASLSLDPGPLSYRIPPHPPCISYAWAQY